MMRMYFSVYRVGKPTKRFSKDKQFFTVDIGFFMVSGNNSGIIAGFVSPSRNWYNLRLVYNRFRGI